MICFPGFLLIVTSSSGVLPVNLRYMNPEHWLSIVFVNKAHDRFYSLSDAVLYSFLSKTADGKIAYYNDNLDKSL